MIRVRTGDDERVLTLEEFERSARRGEVSPFALVSVPAITGDRFVEARELPFFDAMYDPRRVHFRRHFQVGRVPVLSLLLSALMIGLFLLARDLGDGAATREALLLLGAKARSRIIEDGETWRLFAANLLHKDLVHLGFNLFALMNVGAVLEGVYRRGDWVLLVVVSGLATMTASAAFAMPVTVGASGLVFGCLGAAVVFGWRFGDVLPSRYRTYFSVVVVIYAVVMFTLGFVSPSTDNWGHGGGLLAGLVMGMLLEPRLMRLKAVREPVLSLVLPYALALAIVTVVVVFLGPLLMRFGEKTELHRVDAFGVVLERPTTWTKVSDPLGFLTFGNGVDAFASLGCAREEQQRTLDDAERRFVEGELRALSLAGNIGGLDVGRPLPSVVGETKVAVNAREIPFSFVASDGALEARAVLFVRGHYDCALVLAHRPAADERTRARLDDIRRRLALIPTRAEETALQATMTRPGSSRAWLELAIAHESGGALEEARTAYTRALTLVAAEPSAESEVRFAAARFERAVGGDPARGLAALGPLLVENAPVDVALLAAELTLQLGDLDAARTVLERALRHHPAEKRIDAALARLQR
jgi:rhomboid protease GluP